MALRTLSWLLILILLVAPVGIVGGSVDAAPFPAAMVAGHCRGEPQPDPDSTPISDCSLACIAILIKNGELSEPAVMGHPALISAPIARMVGIRIGADPPPPRSA